MSRPVFAAVAVTVLGCAVLPCAVPAAAQDEAAAFYSGKQVRIVVGIGVGSGYDLAARTVGRHIGKYIPGKPDVIVQNQPGAGSATMANALYNGGPKDGTVIGAPFNGMPTIPLLTPDQGRFDTLKFNWVGSANRTVQSSYVWHENTTIMTMADVLTKKFVVGSQAPGSSQHDYPMVANEFFGTKFSVINGYEATPKIHLAMERGEVMGSASTSWSTMKAIAADWIRDKKIRVIGQWGLRKHPDLADVPMWLDLAKTDAERQGIKLLIARQEYGLPYFLPPDVPKARVQAIRRAFDATMKDPGFLADAAKVQMEVDPMTGEDVQQLLAELFATPPDIVARVRKILDPSRN